METTWFAANPITRHGSNPARIRDIQIIRPQRAEIFALPADRCAYSLARLSCYNTRAIVHLLRGGRPGFDPEICRERGFRSDGPG